MAFVSECLQPNVEMVSDDDSALIVDAHSFRSVELAWLIAVRAELEQERAIDQRQYLHSIIVGIGDDDSMSIMIDRDSNWIGELSRLRSLSAYREQEREIDRRQEHQSMVVGICDDDAMMMLVDPHAVRTPELALIPPVRACAPQERLVVQRAYLQSIVVAVCNEDAIMIVIDRYIGRVLELLQLRTDGAKLGHERDIGATATREHLHLLLAGINDEQETSMRIERQATSEEELAISIALILGAERERDSIITLKLRMLHHLASFAREITPH